MNLYALSASHLESAGPVRVALIGAGKFGSMFLSQVPTVPGIKVTAIADLSPERARAACANVGWSDDMISMVSFTDDAVAMMAGDDIDVVVEATGNPTVGIRHARAAIEARKHIIMVNVEADVLAGPLLAREAAQAGVVYSLAYGDQPALICEMVDWARSCGFEVIAAGKGTRYLPKFHQSTPDTVWEYRGVAPEDARRGGMNAQMFNSFIDGTKSGIEMTAVANATGLRPARDGLKFPPVSVSELSSKLNADDGQLEHVGQVEVVSSAYRDGSPVPNDLRWGVYVVFRSPNAYTTRCFREYGVTTDSSGEIAALHRPFHLIGLELNVSILSAALRGEATGAPKDFVADVVAIAKKQLSPGDTLDGEGGYTVWGRVMPAAESLRLGCVPIGLASHARLIRAVEAGQPVCWDDIDFDRNDEAYLYRRRMEAAFAPDIR